MTPDQPSTRRRSADWILSLALAIAGFASTTQAAPQNSLTVGLPALADRPLRIEFEPAGRRSESFEVLVSDGVALVPHPTPADVVVVGRVAGRDDLLITGRRTAAGIDRIRVRPRTGEDAYHLWLEDDGYRVDRVPAMGLEPGSCGVGAEHELVGPALPPGPEGRLGVPDRLDVVGPRVEVPASPTMRSAGDGCVQVAEIGFDLDFEYLSDVGGDVDDAILRVEQSLAETDLLYSEQAQVHFELVRMIVRTDPATDPYYGVVGAGNLLDTLRNEWNTNQQDIQFDLGHLVSGTPASDGILGLAWVTAICTNYCYGLSRTDNPGVFAHEIGHNFSLPHCVDPACTAMCGACMDLGPLSAAQVRSYAESRSCMDPLDGVETPLPPYAAEDRIVATDGFAMVDPLLNDADGNCDPLQIVDFDPLSEEGGSIAALPDGRLAYAAATDFAGPDRFTYVIDDGTGLQSTGVVLVDVTFSGTVTVARDCADADFTRLEEAMRYADPTSGGEILLGPGTWHGPFTTTNPVRVRSIEGPGRTLLTGNDDDTPIITIDAPDGMVLLEGLTFSRADSPADGAAASIDATRTDVIDCRFVDCVSTGDGGALRIEGTTAYIVESRFEGCRGLDGGAISATISGAFASTDSDYLDCVATGEGGALSISAIVARITRTTIGIASASTGNAIAMTGGQVKLTDTTICGSGPAPIAGSINDAGGNDVGGDCDCGSAAWRSPVDCDGDGVDDRCTTLAGLVADDDRNGVPDSCIAPIPAIPARWSVECGGNDHWYEMVVVEDGIDWQAARDAAIDRGGRLVSINSQVENDFIFNAVASDPRGWDGPQGPWLGLWRSGSTWRWDGGEPFDFTNWAPGEPSGSGDRGCLWNGGGITDQWDDQPRSSLKRAYLAEYKGEDCDEDGAPDSWEIALGIEADDDGDGVPDACTAVFGDLDGDGIVNGADMGILLGGFGSTGPGDLNDDGVVNGADIGLILGAFTSSGG